jgi:hypothetical protein
LVNVILIYCGNATEVLIASRYLEAR